MMEGFIFQWPLALALLLFVILLAWLLAYARQARLHAVRAMGSSYSTRRYLRDVLRLLTLALLILAFARPGHSPRTESVTRVGRDIVFALDVSRSMLAQDLSPSRLEVARQAIRDLLASFGNERVGLVVYAGSASILCPLSYDHDFVRYMLDQANPRSVDFGGTTLQAAVEKTVDQVFIQGRGGVQDLIVLTDGGDHGSKMSAVAEQLDSNGVDALIIGLGDPATGSPIPITDEEGNPTVLKVDGATVYTRLNDAALREFARQSSRAHYVPAATSPFNLSQLYANYAAGKTVESATSPSGIRTYREAFFIFLVPALVLLLIAECTAIKGLSLGTTSLFLLVLVAAGGRLEAASERFESDFEAAFHLLQRGDFEQAEPLFSKLYREARESSANAAELAVVQINRGLCLIQLSQARAYENPELALGLAQEAQLAFLSAKRYDPSMQRAGLRVESTSTLINQLVNRLQAIESAEAAFSRRLLQLMEQLQTLLKDQKVLREKTIASDVDRRRPRLRKKSPPLPPVIPPENAAELSLSFQGQQIELQTEAVSAYEFMRSLDAEVEASVSSGSTETETIFVEPLQLISQAIAAQEKAVPLLSEWASWPAGRGEQQAAERALVRILELLGRNSRRDSPEMEDYDDYDFDDYEYTEDSEESMTSSESIQGDFAATSEMQELPVPNYSAEEILLEEQENLQFRQQKRASANAAQVEKDY
ncbi:MAG: VWA domain-containing protein [Verrucomicrobiota bacterium]